MLTADLVRVRKRKGEITPVKLNDEEKGRALLLAGAYIDCILAHVGEPREDLARSLAAVPLAPRDQKWAKALCKLLEDRCDFGSNSELDPAQLRREVFQLSARAYRNGDRTSFCREEILSAAADHLAITKEQLESSLFGDLRGAQPLRAFAPIEPKALLEHYELSQMQALLLRAVRLSATVRMSGPADYRALFRKLKFLQLLFSLERLDDGRYRIEVEGPFSMFEAVTRYGLKFALALPLLLESDHCLGEAAIRWARDAEISTFRFEGGQRVSPAAPPDTGSAGGEFDDFVRAFAQLKSGFRVRPSDIILEAAGIGVCVPDLVFEHRQPSRKIYLEVLGFWSREAVFKRIDMVKGGLRAPVVFAVSEKLRVSDELLGAEEQGALYVYKRTLSPRGVLAKLKQFL